MDEPDSRVVAAVSFLSKNAGGCVLVSFTTSSPQSIVSHKSSLMMIVQLFVLKNIILLRVCLFDIVRRREGLRLVDTAMNTGLLSKNGKRCMQHAAVGM